MIDFRPIGLCLTLALSGCATGAFEVTGKYDIEVTPDGGIHVTSHTVKGGPTLEAEQSQDGAWIIRVVHDDTLDILPGLLDLLQQR